MDGTLIESMKYWNHPKKYGSDSYPSFLDFIKDKYAHDIEPKPHCMELLQLLHDNGIPVCIASDTAKSIAEGFFKRHDLPSLIDFYIGSDDVGTFKAESPKIFLEAAKKLGFPPEECVIFEDRVQYCRSALECGFSVVGVFDEDCRNDVLEMQHICTDYVYDLGKLLKSSSPF